MVKGLTFISIPWPEIFSAEVDVEEHRDLDGEAVPFELAVSFTDTADLSDIETDSLASSGVCVPGRPKSSTLPFRLIFMPFRCS